MHSHSLKFNLNYLIILTIIVKILHFREYFHHIYIYSLELYENLIFFFHCLPAWNIYFWKVTIVTKRKFPGYIWVTVLYHSIIFLLKIPSSKILYVKNIKLYVTHSVYFSYIHIRINNEELFSMFFYTFSYTLTFTNSSLVKSQTFLTKIVKYKTTCLMITFIDVFLFI